MTDFSHDQRVLELIKEHGDAAAAARAFSCQVSKDFFVLSGLLWQLQKEMTKPGKKKAAAGFAQRCDELTGVRGQGLFNATRAYDHCRRVGISAADLEGIAWTGCLVLAWLPLDTLREHRDTILSN